MIPPVVRPETESEAERILFARLAEQLPNTYTVLHGVEWTSRVNGHWQDGEADFLIAHPRHGILVVEVKGGAVACDGASGTWTSTSLDERVYPIKDPVRQVKHNKFALLNLLNDDPATRSYSYPAAHALALPDSIVGRASLGAGVPRDLVIDCNDLSSLESAVRRAFGTEHEAGPGEAGVTALVQSLSPDVHLARPGLGDLMHGEDQEFIRLTAQQSRILHAVAAYPRFAVSGSAGSGKTLLAIEQCRRHLKQGRRVLYTCYTRLLADWVRDDLTRNLAPAQMDRIMVDNYEDVAHCFIARAGGEVPSEHTIRARGADQYYKEELPERFLDALQWVPDRFDAVIVDEGQDFADAHWVTLESLLADEKESAFTIFYDDHQRIFDMQGDYPIKPPHVTLTANCRTTKHIHAGAMAYYGGNHDAECNGPVGRRPQQVEVEDGQLMPTLRRVLHDLTADGVRLDDIVVLTPRSKENSALHEGARLGNTTLTWGTGGPNRVCCQSIQRYKGLESPVILLVEAEHARAERRDALLYVALSRARHHVVVLGQLPAPGEHDRVAMLKDGPARSGER